MLLGVLCSLEGFCYSPAPFERATIPSPPHFFFSSIQSQRDVRSKASKALSPSQRKMLGPARRGTCPIRKNALQKQRQHEGIKGGKCHAGTGSSRSCIQRKVKQMEKNYLFHHHWPTKRFAAMKWSVSSELWARCKREYFVS